MSTSTQITFILMALEGVDAHVGVLQPMARQLVNMQGTDFNTFTNNQGPQNTGLDKYGGVILPGQEAPQPAYSLCWESADGKKSPKWDSDTCKFYRKWNPLFQSNSQMYAPGWSKLDPAVQKDVCAGGTKDVPTDLGKKTVSQLDIKPGAKGVPFKTMILANHWGFYRYYLAANESCAQEWDCYKNTPLNFTKNTLRPFDMCDAGSDAIKFESCNTPGCTAKSTCAGNWVNLTRNEYQEGWQWIPRHWGDFHGTDIGNVLKAVKADPHYNGTVFDNNPSIITDYLDFPDNVPLGDATILWRWETQSQPSTWTNCIDVKFADSSRDGYSCNQETQKCSQVTGGTYSTAEACTAACSSAPPTEDKYVCNAAEGKCEKSADGSMTESECSASCSKTPSGDMYACDLTTYKCSISPDGIYNSSSVCSDNCQKKYSCDQSTGKCIDFAWGEYTSNKTCSENCVKWDKPFVCNKAEKKCSVAPDGNGTYATKDICSQACGESGDMYACDLTTYKCSISSEGIYNSSSVCSDNCQKKYSCDQSTGKCIDFAWGEYTSNKTCSENCVKWAKPFVCNKADKKCSVAPDGNGTYATMDICTEACGKSEEKFTCDMTTQTCSKSDSGEYASMKSCEKACQKTPPKTCQYICLEDRGKCVPSSSRPSYNGTKYNSRKACMKECDCDGVYDQLRDEEY